MNFQNFWVTLEGFWGFREILKIKKWCFTEKREKKIGKWIFGKNFLA